MSTFVILAICLTICYLIYYAVMIGLDLTKQPGGKKTSTEVINVDGAEPEEEETAKKIVMRDDGEIVNVSGASEDDGDLSEGLIPGTSEDDGFNYGETGEENETAPAAATVIIGGDSESKDDEQNAQTSEEAGETGSDAKEPENSEDESSESGAAANAEEFTGDDIPEGSDILPMGDDDENPETPESANDDDMATVSLDEDDNLPAEPQDETGHTTDSLEESVQDILDEFTESLEPIDVHYQKALTAEQMYEEIIDENSLIVKTPVYEVL